MNLHQLRVFCEVANARSFTAAATKLHLTQPAVTWQVQRLEEAYELQFLERAGKRVSLTDAKTWPSFRMRAEGYSSSGTMKTGTL